MFDLAKIHRIQPDAVVQTLHSLEEWQQFALKNDVSNADNMLKASTLVKERGIRSIIAGDGMPSIVEDSDGKHWDFLIRGLDNCNRAVLDLLEASRFAEHKFETKIFAAEATSSLAMALRGIYPRFLGSLYMPDKEVQAKNFPIPHQNLEALTFPSETFDVVISIEVLEHVFDLELCLREQARVCRSGGMMLATFPFYWFSHESMVRARIEGGKVYHLVDEPEYHGDPIKEEGILVVRWIGWDIIEMAKKAGFNRSYMIYYSSVIGGIIGHDIVGRFVFVAEKD